MDLKSSFPEFDPWPETFWQELWDNALIVFDTNALVDLYAMEPETREQLFAFLEGVKGRLWLPYQVAYEYRKNRHRSTLQQIGKYKAAISNIEEAGKATREAYADRIGIAIRQLKESRMPAVVTTGEGLSSAFQALEKNVAECVAKLEKDIEADLTALLKPLRDALKEQEALFQEDPILDRLTDMFGANIGEKPAPERLEAVYKLGEKRYKADPPMPPGYKDQDDKDKPGNQKYGDLVLWREIVEYAKAKELPVILVNNEKKEDWVETVGRQLRPHRELVREFFDDTSGRHFWLYPTEAFMAAAARYAGATFSKEAIEDAAKVTELLEKDRNVPLTAQTPDVRVVANPHLIKDFAPFSGRVQAVLGVTVQNHSPVPVFLSGISLEMKDGMVMTPLMDDVTGEQIRQRELQVGQSCTLFINPERLREHADEFICARATDAVGRVYRSSEEYFPMIVKLVLAQADK